MALKRILKAPVTITRELAEELAMSAAVQFADKLVGVCLGNGDVVNLTYTIKLESAEADAPAIVYKDADGKTLA